MAGLRRRAEAALAARLGATHAATFEQALVPGFSAAQIAALHADLARGAPAELRPTRAGVRPVLAASSSTALVVNAFGRWLGEERALRAAGLGGFDAPLVLEKRLHIPHGGGTPNLDCWLEGSGVRVGIESKLLEHLDPRPPRPWKPAYRRPAMAAVLAGGWATVFDDLLTGAWAPAHLDAAQLVKHALSLAALPGAQLLYCFWTPADGAALPEVRRHAEELARLVETVGESSPRLHARSYAAVLEEWAALPGPAWLPAHVDALRARYDVAAGL